MQYEYKKRIPSLSSHAKSNSCSLFPLEDYSSFRLKPHKVKVSPHHQGGLGKNNWNTQPTHKICTKNYMQERGEKLFMVDLTKKSLSLNNYFSFFSVA